MTKESSVELIASVTSAVLIPACSVLLASSCIGCILNILMNCFLHADFLKTFFHRLRRSSYTDEGEYYNDDSNYGAPIEVDPTLGNRAPTMEAYKNSFYDWQNSATNDLQNNSVRPMVEGGPRDSLQSARLEAQRVVFVYNRKYMIIATAKSLAMLVVLQYHYDNKGGWDRLVVCSAANVMSGLLTPILEYAAGLLLPLDGDLETKNTTVDQEESSDSVLIVEVLTRVGRLQLDDLETVLIQGSTFIVFGAVFLPAVVVFCLAGFAFFFWMFMPCWILYVVLRRNYYRHSGTGRGASAGGVMSAFSTPVGELGKATLLKIMTLFLLQWTVQCSFLFGLVLMEGGSYREALRLEARHQFFGWYNPLEMTRFQWLCFASQIFF